jgi:hypothetical protein
VWADEAAVVKMIAENEPINGEGKNKVPVLI